MTSIKGNLYKELAIKGSVVLLLNIWGVVPLFAQEEIGLAAALRATLSQHPALGGKRAEIDEKKFMGDSARAQRYPSLSGQISAQHTNNYPVGIRARQPLWAFGRIDNGIAYADTDVQVQTADLLRVKRDFLEKTAVAYVRILGIRERLNVADDNETSLDVLYQQIKRREEGLIASRADVRLARARYLQAQSRKERMLSELGIAENELISLTQSYVNSTQDIPKQVTLLSSAEEMAILAQSTSAEVRFKEEKIHLAQAGVEREKSLPMPTVYLQMDYFYNHQETGNSDIRVGVTVEADLEGMGFAAYGRNNAAGAKLQAVRAELNTTRNEIKREVNSLYTNRQAQEEIALSQTDSVTELSEILLSYQRQYNAGQKPWLEVLNMQRELTEQRYQLVQSKNDWLLYTLKLSALTGGLDALVGKKVAE